MGDSFLSELVTLTYMKCSQLLFFLVGKKKKSKTTSNSISLLDNTMHVLAFGENIMFYYVTRVRDNWQLIVVVAPHDLAKTTRLLSRGSLSSFKYRDWQVFIIEKISSYLSRSLPTPIHKCPCKSFYSMST